MAFYRGSLLETFILQKLLFDSFLTQPHFFGDCVVSAGSSWCVQCRLWSESRRNLEASMRDGRRKGVLQSNKLFPSLYFIRLFFFSPNLGIMPSSDSLCILVLGPGQVSLVNEVSNLKVTFLVKCRLHKVLYILQSIL